MKSKTALAIGFILFLLALPLISIGSAREIGILFYLGLAAIIVGAALPPFIRFSCRIAGTWLSEQNADWRRTCNQ